MIGVTGTLLLASLVSFSATAAAQATGQETTPSPPLSLLDVPYLSQSEALCGGAAAAMVLRYWGATGVAAEDFAPLMDRGKGGIETAALTTAVQARGYQAVAASGTQALVQRELSDGRPVIALIEDRPGIFHYVVVVGWHARAVVLHDPARNPYVLMKPDEFERRWKPGGNWMLAVAPGKPVQSTGSESTFRVPVQSGCEALVSDGIRAAQQNDLSRAERLLATAAYQCEGAAPVRELAGVRLLQKRWPDVRELAGRAVDIDPADAHAWRLLATARFIEGDHLGALDAWNHAAEPRVDLVSIDGLARTSHRAVERFIRIRPRTLLTRSEFDRAQRRLAELPAAMLTRFEYVPRGSGLAEVRAHVLERGLVPRGTLTWTATGLHAAAMRELAVPVASLGHGGERLDVTWRFWPERPAAGAVLQVPASFGLFSLELSSERQPFTSSEIADAERFTTRARVADWATGSLRWEARGGYARWLQQGSFATVGGSTRFDRGRASVGADVDAWLGNLSFVTTRLRGRWRSSAARRGLVIDLSGTVEAVTRDGPLDLWPSGDTGQARQSLLRAHPVLDDGRLCVDRLGRRIMQSTGEAQYWWRTLVPIGAALFVDAARVTRRGIAAPTSSPLTDIDAGLGFRLAFPGRGTFRADFAHGLRDGRNALSLGWSP